MFIAHLPAAYLLTTGVQRLCRDRQPAVMAAGLATGILPDFDLLYFYLWDGRQHPHHHYITHWPLVWLAVMLMGILLCLLFRKPRAMLFVGVIGANGLLHMALDTVASHIQWLAPFSRREFNWVDVPARYDWWVWNFLGHWTFGLELAICAAALVVWLRSRHPAPDHYGG